MHCTIKCRDLDHAASKIRFFILIIAFPNHAKRGNYRIKQACLRRGGGFSLEGGGMRTAGWVRAGVGSLVFLLALLMAGEPAAASFRAELDAYGVRVVERTELGPVPALEIDRHGLRLFRLPLVSGLDSADGHEHLSDIRFRIAAGPGGSAPLYEIVAMAASSLWREREFHWRLYADHIEFDQSAAGRGAIGRCHFFSNGRPGRWDAGESDGSGWNSLLLTDRYWTPSPNHANRFEFGIAEPQTLGFGAAAAQESEDNYHPDQMTGLFAPPPLMMAFHREGEWASVGIGTKPGLYRFPALDYSGSRYAGVAWWVDYLGYQRMEDLPQGRFQSPVAALHFAYSAADSLKAYSDWMRQSGFAAEPRSPDVHWHHLPIFCGWAEQTSLAVPYGRPANAEATQKNYEAWLAELDERGLPIGTIVIDDKWQKGYGSFDVDPAKWPDLKGFVAAQHARGRHVLLWVPDAHKDGLPDDLCAHGPNGECLAPDLGNPAYETYLRGRIRTLVESIGIDGFKLDWMWAPVVPGLPVPPELAGLEAIRRFQDILYSETHRWRPDAMIETQTPNAAFRDSSDVLRLNDVWYATRDVVETMRERARIARISGWNVVDTDNASSTNLESWWRYMETQPSIGIPALYFVHRTETTLEEPSAAEWNALAAIWRGYVAGL